MKRGPLMVLSALLVTLLSPVAWAVNSVELSEAETRLSGSDKPLMARRLGRVMIDVKAPCLNCGDFSFAGSATLASMVDSRFRGEFLNELKRQLRTNGVLDTQSEKRISLLVNVLQVRHDISVGAAKQRSNMVTNGGTMVTSLTLEYVLSDGDREVLRMPLQTTGASDSILGRESISESINTAMKKNMRIFLLGIKAALDPAFKGTAETQIQAIATENGSTRTLIGSFVRGIGLLGNGAVAVAGGTLQILASPDFAKGMNQGLQENQRMQQVTDAILNPKPPQAQESTPSSTSKSKSARSGSGASSSADAAAAARKEREAAEKARKEAQLRKEKEAQALKEAQVQKDKDAAAQKQLEQQRREEELKRQEKKHQDELRLAEEERQRKEKQRLDEQHKKEEIARREAEKLARQREEAQAKADYLNRMRSGIRLGARNCFGETHVGGTRPSGKEVVSCIDVSFTAYCPGSSAGTSAVAKNFVGFDAGCFGDTTQIAKPPCKPAELRVVVDDVRACR